MVFPEHGLCRSPPQHRFNDLRAWRLALANEWEKLLSHCSVSARGMSCAKLDLSRERTFWEVEERGEEEDSGTLDEEVCSAI